MDRRMKKNLSLKNLSKSVNSTIFLNDTVIDYVAKGKSGGGAYFEDGIRKVHYVILVTRIGAYKNYDPISHVIHQLEDMGLQFEQSLGITIPAVFVKIHIPDDVAVQYLATYDIIPEFLTDFNYLDPKPDRLSTFKTPLENRNVFKDCLVEQLSANKTKIIFKMLKKIPYGPDEDQIGIEKLKAKGLIQDHYALHDGPIQVEYWHNDDLLNERTLLAKYWANYNVWYKQQPLDLIHKYFGAEVAFYFAWSDFYNKMLAPLSIIGILLSVYSWIDLTYYPSHMLVIMCSSSETVCGTCEWRFGCQLLPAKKYCGNRWIIEVFQHTVLLYYALSSTVWGFCFLKIWKRKEYALKHRWNLFEQSLQEEINIRLEFKEKLHGRARFNRHEKFLRILWVTICYCAVVTFVWAFIYIKVIILSIIKILMINTKVTYNINNVIATISYTAQAIFTMTMSKYISKWGTKMTNVLYPRTQSNYDNDFLFITCSLDLVNSYSPLLHSALFKDFFYNVPELFGPVYIRNDACDPLPCLFAIFFQLSVLMTLKTVIEKIVVICYPKIKKIVRYYMFEHLKKKDMPQYEEEYSLKSTTRQMMNNYFSKRVIQYGMVLIFIYSFPLAPFCALVHNVLAIRMEAINLVYNTRRPQLTKQVNSIGLWDHVLLYLTIFSAALNAIVITFSGDTLHHDAMPPNYTLRDVFSIFNPKDLRGQYLWKKNVTNECLFRGQRYPAGHYRKYQTTDRHFQLLTKKLLTVFVYECILAIICVFVYHIINSMPLTVKKRCLVDRTNLENKYNEFFNEKLELLRPEEKQRLLRMKKSATDFDDDTDSEDLPETDDLIKYQVDVDRKSDAGSVQEKKSMADSSKLSKQVTIADEDTDNASVRSRKSK